MDKIVEWKKSGKGGKTNENKKSNFDDGVCGRADRRHGRLWQG